MHVEQHGFARGSLARKFCVQHRLTIVGKLPRRKAALAERLFEPVDVAANVLGHHRIIGHGQQFEIFAVAGLCLALRRLRGECGGVRHAGAQPRCDDQA
ncbi:hypothetical protein D3C72_1681130 [compost metagenome]